MKTMNTEMAIATIKWRKLNGAYTLVTQLAGELPPEVTSQLDPWIRAMDALKAAAKAHNAVLAPAESDMMGNWLNSICSVALDDSAAALLH